MSGCGQLRKSGRSICPLRALPSRRAIPGLFPILVHCPRRVPRKEFVWSTYCHPHSSVRTAPAPPSPHCSRSQRQMCFHIWGWYRPAHACFPGRDNTRGRSWGGLSWRGSPAVLCAVILSQYFTLSFGWTLFSGSQGTYCQGRFVRCGDTRI